MQGDDEGFLILESLIAIIILAAVGIALMGVSKTLSNSALVVRDDICADLVAHNRLQLALITPPTEDKDDFTGKDYMCQSDWRWKMIRIRTRDPRFDLMQIQVFKNENPKSEAYALLPEQ